MHEYINLTAENIDNEHICCAIGDPKHQCWVDKKKERIKSKLKDWHVFRKLNDRGKIFIEYLIIKQNLFWAFIYNICIIPIAIWLIEKYWISLTPVFGAIAMVISSLCVILNSIRLKIIYK